MSQRMSKKRKNAWKEKIQLMREIKLRKRLEAEEQQESMEVSTATGNMDDSILLPAPSTTTNDEMGEDTDSDDEDYVEDIATEDIPSLYSDWLDEIDREDAQMFAMMLYDIFVKRLKLPKTTTAEEVGHCFGITGRTVRYSIFITARALPIIWLLQ